MMIPFEKVAKEFYALTGAKFNRPDRANPWLERFLRADGATEEDIRRYREQGFDEVAASWLRRDFKSWHKKQLAEIGRAHV